MSLFKFCWFLDVCDVFTRLDLEYEDKEHMKMSFKFCWFLDVCNVFTRLDLEYIVSVVCRYIVNPSKLHSSS